jgi:hypothetical protein
MKRIITFNLVLILMLLFFNGCTTTFYTTTNAEKVYPQTNEKDVTITTESSLPKPFEEIGYISTTQTNIEGAKDKLRERASEMGGNAILNFKITVVREYIYIIFIPIPVDRYICRGMIVKYL